MDDLTIFSICILTAIIIGKIINAFDNYSDEPRGRKPTRKK
jgi:hypothetical protein